MHHVAYWLSVSKLLNIILMSKPWVDLATVMALIALLGGQVHCTPCSVLVWELVTHWRVIDSLVQMVRRLLIHLLRSNTWGSSGANCHRGSSNNVVTLRVLWRSMRNIVIKSLVHIHFIMRFYLLLNIRAKPYLGVSSVRWNLLRVVKLWRLGLAIYVVLIMLNRAHWLFLINMNTHSIARDLDVAGVVWANSMFLAFVVHLVRYGLHLGLIQVLHL